MKWDTCHGWTDTWTNILTISTCVWNMSNHIVIVVIYGLTYLSFFKISFWWVLFVFDVSSTVYFRFWNYRITYVVFISDNIVSFSFSIRKCESESGGVFRRCFRPFSSLSVRHQCNLQATNVWLAQLALRRYCTHIITSRNGQSNI